MIKAALLLVLVALANAATFSQWKLTCKCGDLSEGETECRLAKDVQPRIKSLFPNTCGSDRPPNPSTPPPRPPPATPPTPPPGVPLGNFLP